MTLLRIQGLTRRYPQPRQKLLRARAPLTALDDVSLTLAPGETIGIIGESGSGKSTLARLIMGFERPDAGQIFFDGDDLATLSARALRHRRPDFQMIFQDPFSSLDPRRSVGWSIAQPLRARRARRDSATISQRVANTLERVGLSASDSDRFPHEFSGGQRQRIAIARAIITNPRLLVADEAVSALDVSVRAQILNLLMDLHDETGLAIVFISHDLAVVSSLCDSLLVLRQGRVVEQGNAQGILTRPRHEYTQMLLSAARFSATANTPWLSEQDPQP